MKHYTLHSGQTLTAEQEARLDALTRMPDEEIICDEECPELTDAQLAQMTRRNAKIRKSA